MPLINFGREERKLLLDALEDAANEDTNAFFLSFAIYTQI